MSRNIVDEQKAEALQSVFESDLDDLIEDAVKVVCQYDRASASLIQRRLSIGYARAARIMDQLEAMGVIGSSEGSEPREVLITNPDEVKQIKRKEKKVYEEPQLKYKAPKLSVINKPKQNPWKYSLSDITKKLGENEAMAFPLGFDESKKLILGNLKELGSLIITGNIWSNKEFFLDTLLTSLILKNSPRAIRLVLIDESR
jgi:DNA segregation ATPase FtsK/SpoIIIE-like protein